MKLTNPRSILMGLALVALAIFFRLDDSSLLIAEAKAEVAGMNYYELRSDYDFKRAVKSIAEDVAEDVAKDVAEDCYVSGFVIGNYLSSASILC